MDAGGPPSSVLWHGSNTRAHRHKWAALDGLPRPGTRRSYDASVKQQQVTTPAAADSTSCTLLAAGSIIKGSSGGSNSVLQHSYCLESQVHHGPRSEVWKATRIADGSPVILKVLPTSTPQQHAAATQELQMMQLLSAAPASPQHTPSANLASTANALAAAGTDHTHAAAAAAPICDGSLQDNRSTTLTNTVQMFPAKHLVQLLDSFFLQAQQAPGQQQPRRQQATGATSSGNSQCKASVTAQLQSGIESPHIARSAASPSPASAVDGSGAAAVLVLQPLHQSLSWVLHFIRQRNGRHGLPPAAVRSIAHQLLSGLAKLHDEHAVVHRDVKPSNMLLQQSFVVRKGRHKMRSMTLQELTSAQWSLIDLGSAAQLLPPAPQPVAAAAAAAAASGAETLDHGNISIGSNSNSRIAGSGLTGNSFISRTALALQQLASGSSASSSAASSSSPSSSSPSSQKWTAAEGSIVPYETPAYTPPEALLHIPATAAYDIWSAACCIFEAASGRVLFPVEAAAAARGFKVPKQLAVNRALDSDGSASECDDGFEIDQLHLKMMKGVCGQPPTALLQRSPFASELFAEPSRGRLWIEAEHDDSYSTADAPELLSFWGFGKKDNTVKPSKPVLQQLMAHNSMPLQEAISLADFLQPMLAWDPDERPTAAQLLEHPYFKRLLLEQEQQAANKHGDR